jgi:hypothetical protein
MPVQAADVVTKLNAFFHSSFVIISCSVIRHSSFALREPRLDKRAVPNTD